MGTTVVFIRSMAFLGSQLVVYPFLYQIKRARPDDAVHVVARDPLQNYYRNLPWVDRFVLAQNSIERFRSMPSDTRVAVVLHRTSEEFSVLAAARRVPIRLGFRNRRVSDFLWTHSRYKDPNEYIGLANLNLLRTLHDFDPGEASRGCVDWFADQSNRSAPLSDVVFMVGGGGGPFKRWGVRNYMDLAVQLKNLLGPDITFAFVLGPAEGGETAILRQCARPEFRLLISCPLADIAYVARHAKLVVANDCGPSHIAQNACVPYVGVFHEPNPEWFWARRQSVCVVPNDGSGNISAITVEQVYEACLQVLSGRLASV